MKILVTGSAGFIGAATSSFLISKGFEVVGIDNLNDYYDPSLKNARLSQFFNCKKYKHYHLDISNSSELETCFEHEKPSIVINLAAQAGVRHSIDNAKVFLDSNITGFLNILEACRKHSIQHLIYASSSSVYGGNTLTPYSTKHRTDKPLNIYGVTKKTNELMAYAYNNLYNLQSTGLRFFTVYGPWGRPDMALLKFVNHIVNNKPINLYNYGNHTRDFTFIDDVVFTIYQIINLYKISNDTKNTSDIINVGAGKPTSLIYFVKCIEDCLGKKAIINYLPPALGDMLETSCDVEDLFKKINFIPNTPLIEGISRTIKWYFEFKNLKF